MYPPKHPRTGPSLSRSSVPSSWSFSSSERIYTSSRSIASTGSREQGRRSKLHPYPQPLSAPAYLGEYPVRRKDAGYPPHEVDPLSVLLCHRPGKWLEEIQAIAEDDLRIRFDLRICLRTFGQSYLERDLDIESVSVLMGHSTTRMTETFYNRRRLDDALRKARGAWKGGDAEGKR